MQTIRLITAIALLGTGITAYAGEQAEPRLPAQMNNEDWEIINTAQDSYHECMQGKMLEFSENSDDPRVISDQVLEVCSGILIKLNHDLDERNINPYFSQKYIYNMKNKAAQQLLRNLMMMIASRQEKADTAPGVANEE